MKFYLIEMPTYNNSFFYKRLNDLLILQKQKFSYFSIIKDQFNILQSFFKLVRIFYKIKFKY